MQFKIKYHSYLPFGESLIDQRQGTGVRYTFSGKECDEETGYSYFGARYYDSDLSVWLSVDPMTDKYPGTSAFMYCLGNPIMYTDNEGRFPIPYLFRKNFPYITKYIENNLENYIVNSPKILSVLSKYSVGMLTVDQINKDFKPDSGPTINSKAEEFIGYGGEYDYSSNTIYFSEQKLLCLNEILKSDKITTEQKQMSIFEFLKTFINEYVHYGDALDGYDAIIDYYGNIVNDYNEPEPRWGNNVFEEGNEAVRELFPFDLNGRQLYYYYKYGEIIDKISNKVFEKNNSYIDDTMIPTVY